MQINDELFNRLAGLSKLRFTEDEKKQVMADLNNILVLFDNLKAIDTDHLESLSLEYSNRGQLRNDEVKEFMLSGQALKNSPETQNGFFKVPVAKKQGEK